MSRRGNLAFFLALFLLLFLYEMFSVNNVKDLSSFESLMEARRKRVQEKCLNSDQPFKIDKFYYQKDVGLLWCPVYKSASTNWLHNFFALSSIEKGKKSIVVEQHGGRMNEVVNILYPTVTHKRFNSKTEMLKELRNDTKLFLIVRHPFNRLVSAYRDKIEQLKGPSPRKDYYYKLYGEKIHQRFRTAALAKFGNAFFSRENNFGSPFPLPKRTTKILPSFWEFVQFILSAKSSSDMDGHWQPMSTFCHPCPLDYDFILHFESLAVEEPQMVKRLGLEDRIKLQKTNPSPSIEGISENEMTAIYFRQLSRRDILGLYRIYRRDFELFGYSFRKFFLHFDKNHNFW